MPFHLWPIGEALEATDMPKKTNRHCVRPLWLSARRHYARPGWLSARHYIRQCQCQTFFIMLTPCTKEGIKSAY